MREMDEKSMMKWEVIQGLFENGFMGAEIPDKYDGPGATFFMVCASCVFSSSLFSLFAGQPHRRGTGAC